MKKKLLAAIIVALFCANAFASEGEVFLTLTKTKQNENAISTNSSSITKAMIAAKGASTLGEILSDQVGMTASVTGTHGSQSTLMIRGAKAEQTLVLIDGIRANDNALGLFDLSTMPSEIIEKIEIVRGPSSALYGSDALGGVINVITKKPKQDTLDLKVNTMFSSFNTQKYIGEFQTKKENHYIFTSISKTQSDGYRENSKFDALNAFAKAGIESECAGAFDLSARYYENQTGVSGMAFENQMFFIPLSVDKYDGVKEITASTPNAKQKENKKDVTLSHNIKISENVSNKSDIYFKNDARNYKDSSSFWASDDEYISDNFGAQTQFDLLCGFSTGIEWKEEKLKQNNLLLDITTLEKSRVNSALFISQNYQNNILTVIPGLRYDTNSAFGGMLTPRLTTIVSVSENVKISANAAKGWRSPTFNELYYPADAWGMHGNIDLKPEEAIGFDLGAEYKTNTFNCALTGFSSETTNLISWGMLTPTNIGKSNQSGLEFEIGGKVVDGLFHNLNYTYLWAQDTENKRVLNYRPCNTINYSLNYFAPFDIALDANIKYVSSQETWDFTTPKLPEYATVDLKASKNFGTYTIWAKGLNLTNTRFQTRLGYPLPGISVEGGISIDF